MRICVYCASSQDCDPHLPRCRVNARRLLAEAGCTVVYGGGSVGSMGAVANGALSAGGEVIGILPHFMADLEWGHPGLTSLELVEDMRERKHRLLTGSDAVVALPGGCGTLEELFEAITLKRLGLYFNPIILLNTRGFYTPLQRFMESMIEQRFMNTAASGRCGSLVDSPKTYLPAIRATPRWREDAREIRGGASAADDGAVTRASIQSKSVEVAPSRCLRLHQCRARRCRHRRNRRRRIRIRRRRLGAVDRRTAVGLLFPARLDRIVRFGVFQFERSDSCLRSAERSVQWQSSMAPAIE